jgi:hypothetical protein
MKNLILFGTLSVSLLIMGITQFYSSTDQSSVINNRTELYSDTVDIQKAAPKRTNPIVFR